MSKKKSFFSMEDEKNHHKEFVRHFEVRIDPILTKAKEAFSIKDQLDIFDKMYEWTINHLHKFEDNAFELVLELLENYIEKDKSHETEESVRVEIVELLYLQFFIKLHSHFLIGGKHDHFQSVLMYLLSKKLIKLSVKSDEEIIYGLFALMIAQDQLRRTPFFFPEVIICFERMLAYLLAEIKQKKVKLDKKQLDPNEKAQGNKKELLVMSQIVFEGALQKQKIEQTSFYVLAYKVLDKLLNSFCILFGSDTNCDLLLPNLMALLGSIDNPILLAYSETTISKYRNLIENCKMKSDMNIIKDKPLIRIRFLTPRIEDSDDEAQGDYDEEMKKQKKKLKKAVDKEQKKAMKELAHDAMVLQSQKDQERAKQEEKKKSSFRNFAKFMEDQKLEEKRIKTTQLQHKPRNKTKKRRLAGNKTADS